MNKLSNTDRLKASEMFARKEGEGVRQNGVEGF